MNYNEEMYKLFNELGIKGELITISKKDKATPSDYKKLEDKILLKTEKNRNMMFLSEIYSQDNLPCGNNKVYTKNKKD